MRNILTPPPCRLTIELTMKYVCSIYNAYLGGWWLVHAFKTMRFYYVKFEWWNYFPLGLWVVELFSSRKRPPQNPLRGPNARSARALRAARCAWCAARAGRPRFSLHPPWLALTVAGAGRSRSRQRRSRSLIPRERRAGPCPPAADFSSPSPTRRRERSERIFVRGISEF